MNKAINRTTVQVEDNKFRVYPKQGPLFYKNSNGELNEIDLTFNDSTSTIGDISLMDKGILSIGKRKDKNPYKITGIRPDNCQTGEKQLEFSVVNIELDDEKQDFDDIEILLNVNSIYQLVKLNKKFGKIKIEFDIHNTGLEIINSKYTEESKMQEYGFNITNIGDNNGSNTLGMYNGYNSLNKDISYLDFYVGKINDEYITTGEYTNEEEFGDSDLSQYTLEQMYSHGSSIYFKDCIILACKPYGIENFESLIVNNLCDLYGLEVFNDGGSGVYFTKDNKKVGGYYSNDKTFFAFFNTKDIPNEIKTLFKRKSFEDTSFLDITTSELEEEIKNRFDKNLDIIVDSSYYQGDFFQFKINNESVYINKPIAFNENFEQLNYYTTHTLKDNEDGTYRYTKYLSPESALNINDATYIDATLSTSSSTSDGTLWNSKGSSSTDTIKTADNFEDIRQAGWANKQTQGVIPVSAAGEKFQRSTNVGQSGTVISRTWEVYQTHYHFDSSGVSGTLTSLSFNFYGRAFVNYGTDDPYDFDYIFVKSNFDGTYPLTTIGSLSYYNTWNDFEGVSGFSSWAGTDTTEYSTEQTITEGSGFSNPFITPSVSFNADAKSDISSDSDFAFAVIEHTQYYSDNLDTSFGNLTTDTTKFNILQIGSVSATDTSHRPYLEYTVAGSTPIENATFFGASF